MSDNISEPIDSYTIIPLKFLYKHADIPEEEYKKHVNREVYYQAEEKARSKV